jgi:hypothetical protein
MKYVSYVLFCAILLCCPVLHSQSALTLSADDVKFLRGCGVRQDDINVIPKLPSDGQIEMTVILDAKRCSVPSLKDFIGTRDYLRKFTPPPSVSPEAPVHYDLDFVTLAEREYINNYKPCKTWQ